MSLGLRLTFGGECRPQTNLGGCVASQRGVAVVQQGGGPGFTLVKGQSHVSVLLGAKHLRQKSRRSQQEEVRRRRSGGAEPEPVTPFRRGGSGGPEVVLKENFGNFSTLTLALIHQGLRTEGCEMCPVLSENAAAVFCSNGLQCVFSKELACYLYTLYIFQPSGKDP